MTECSFHIKKRSDTAVKNREGEQMHKLVSVNTIIWRDKNERCLQQLKKSVQHEHSTTEKLEISKVSA